jgi:osmoprotectant transport system permease protein
VDARANPVLALCATLSAGAALTLPLVRVAPNRLLSGEPVLLSALMPAWGWGVPMLLLVIALYPMLGVQRHSTLPSQPPDPSPEEIGAGQPPDPPAVRWVAIGVLITMALTMAGLLYLASTHAVAIAHSQSRLARTSLGAGFWSLAGLAWLTSLDAASQLSRSAWRRSALLAAVALPSMLLLAWGVADDLSIMKEYDNRRDEFGAAVLRHLQIVATAILPSVLLGLPLAWACSRYASLRGWMLTLLNIIQTIPSIALFGLFMVPLAWAATRFPGLAEAGIRGVGLAPAVLALVLYSLLPIVRSGLAGLAQVPAAAKTAAQAMGMSAWQIFYRIEVPLALPVLLPGLRTAVVQTIGLAAVTALVGAGGLGALMFDGLFSAANELVLLGVLPIVLMALMADTGFKLLSQWLSPADTTRADPLPTFPSTLSERPAG